MRTIEIKIMTTKRVVSRCNEKKGEGRWWSTWQPQLGWPLIVASTKEKGWRPPRSQLGGLWTIVTKKEEEEDHDQDCDQDDHN